jgi:acyl-CoA reductase-like NAD-dependent aldehyde dehydrogenase
VSEVQNTFSPIDGRLLVERVLARPAALDRAIHLANRAFSSWRERSLEDRSRCCEAWIAAVLEQADDAALEITQQMGRPLQYAPGELRGFAERGRAMIELAPHALRDWQPSPIDGFQRYVKREPLGVVLVLAPWNYPWLTAVNTIVPALLAGNTVLLKHSDQTPLVAERMTAAARQAGIPEGVFEHIHMSHARTAQAVQDKRIAYVAFTGSVAGGAAVHGAAAGTFKAVGLELGGKDPAYVRHDTDLSQAIENLVDGAFFNSGQSCCGVERIYVHHTRYRDFVDGVVELVRGYRLGDPTDPSTTLGPVVRRRSAEAIESQVRAAISSGARALIDPSQFPAVERGHPYLAPQVLVNVDHSMDIMREETFGPVVGIMSVRDDEEAIQKMNDSAFGLTASIWTASVEDATAIGQRLETGSVFMNRCDYLDPQLAWVGVKQSGRGCTLSPMGFESLTRPKSFHLRTRWSS